MTLLQHHMYREMLVAIIISIFLYLRHRHHYHQQQHHAALGHCLSSSSQQTYQLGLNHPLLAIASLCPSAGLLDATAPATIVMPAASRPDAAAAFAGGGAPVPGGFPMGGVGGAGAGAAAPMPGMGFPGAAPGAVGGVGGVFGAPAGAPGMGMGPACGVDAATLAAAAAAAAAASAGMPAGAAGGAACLPTFGIHPAAAGPPGGAPMAM